MQHVETIKKKCFNRQQSSTQCPKYVTVADFHRVVEEEMQHMNINRAIGYLVSDCRICLSSMVAVEKQSLW